MKKLALLLLAAPLALAACGGGSSSVKVDPVAYVKHAAHKTADVPSEHVSMTMMASVAGQEISMKGSGDYVNSPPRGAVAMSALVMGQDVQFNAVQDGSTIYMQSPVFSAQLPAGKTWMKLDLAKAGAAQGLNVSSLMSRSPAQALQQLEAAGTVKSFGTEAIDGVETTHYVITNLDLSKMPEGAKIQALAHPKYGPIGVWVGNKDGYVHRERMLLRYSVQGQSASMVVQSDLSKFGEKVNVTVPPASAVFDATSLAGAGVGA